MSKDFYCKKCGCLAFQPGSGLGLGDWKQDSYRPELGLCRACYYYGLLHPWEDIPPEELETEPSEQLLEIEALYERARAQQTGKPSRIKEDSQVGQTGKPE